MLNSKGRGIHFMSETKRLRRPAEGGYARGEETRMRIIDAAIDLFGEHGFAATSTRDIAARAGVNAPALQYYFENKEGVYRACAEYFADFVWTTFEPVVRSASEALESGVGIAQLIDAFIAIQDQIADNMFKMPKSPSQRLFFVREQGGHEPSIASDILQERVRGPLTRVSAGLVAKITGGSADDPVTTIRAITLYGQLMLFHVSPRSTLRHLGWQEIDAEKGELLKSTVRAQTRALLEMWSAEREAREAAAPKPARKRTSKTRG
jgi:TetR/AcrR family transcriptional regulator, regulator of cefoperazone and chloramphenicol sensitivity